jgi:hypothetical protein
MPRRWAAGNPSTVSRDAHDVDDSGMRVAEKALNVLVMLLLKVAALVVSPGAGIAARCTSARMP